MSSPSNFSIARLPHLVFGNGVIQALPDYMLNYPGMALIIVGAKSFISTPEWISLRRRLGELGVDAAYFKCNGKEPSPDEVDSVVAQLEGFEISVVVGIGGGSVLDLAKAVAGMLEAEGSVVDYLEGVGQELNYQGPSVPFIAVPTTAGTGSEATKNAVLSKHGPDGYKKSFRDEALVAQYALVDPALLATCPAEIIAGNGMDAFTQLLESYVSLRANPITDALAEKGMIACRDGLLPLYESAGQDADAREKMALASYLSGVNLAQTGLGSVHGLASPLGAYFPIPHGIVCGTLVNAATKINIAGLKDRKMKGQIAWKKYAEAGRIMAKNPALDDDQAVDALINLLGEWTTKMPLPTLAHYGVTKEDFPRIVANSKGSSMKTNPIVLEDREIEQILLERL